MLEGGDGRWEGDGPYDGATVPMLPPPLPLPIVLILPIGRLLGSHGVLLLLVLDELRLVHPHAFVAFLRHLGGGEHGGGGVLYHSPSGLASEGGGTRGREEGQEEVRSQEGEDDEELLF